MAFPLPVSADMGPKASITIHCSNLPEGEVYLDLLIDEPPFLNQEGYRFGNYDWGDDPEYYNPEMLAVLKNYNVDGWRPALVTGTSLPLWGELSLNVRDGKATASFGYMGVPSRFKIIAVSESGIVSVSNIIDKKTLDSTVYFDFAANTAAEQSYLPMVLKQFALTLSLTLLIEGLILIAFRFSLRQNWKPFLFVNLSTQIALHAAVAFAYTIFGTGLAVAAFVLMEFIILIVEIVLYIFLLKQHTKKRRALYAVTANIASFFAGIVIMIIIYGAI
jgi:hypothetical protein